MFNVGMHVDVYEAIWFKHGVIIDIIELFILRLVLLTLTFIEGHWSARKQKLQHLFSHIFQLMWMEFGILLKVAGLMNLILILSYPFYVRERESYLCYFVKKKKKKM